MRCDFSQAGIEDMRAKLTAISRQTDAERVLAHFNVLSEDDRTLTAQALAACRAEVCAVQEVENLVTLITFHDTYLQRWTHRPYDRKILVEGNDGRGIDVALLSQWPVSRIVSHSDKTYRDLNIKPPKGQAPSERVFRRDCLEVDIVKDGRALTLFIVHFKSMHGGRAKTRAVREGEAAGVRTLICRRFGVPAEEDWVVLGDFNDYFELDGKPVNDHGLGALLRDGFAHDLARLTIPDGRERWSHHYAPLDQYTALDHILLSPRLAELNRGAKARFIRAGIAGRSSRYRGYRLAGIGWHAPKASDHCPLVASIQFEGRPVKGEG